MLTAEGFIEARRPDGADWSLSDNEMNELAEMTGTELPQEWSLFFSNHGGHECVGEIERSSFVEWTVNASFILDSLNGLRSGFRSLAKTGVSEKLGVPIFPIGGTSEGDLIVQAGQSDDSPILALVGSQYQEWLIAESFRGLLDSAMLPPELGYGDVNRTSHSEWPQLEVSVDRSEVENQLHSIRGLGLELRQQLVDISPVSLLGGTDLSQSRLVGLIQHWWFRGSSGGVTLPIFMLRSRLGALVGLSSAIAAAKLCDASIRDDVGFLGLGIGAEVGPDEAIDAYLALNNEGLQLEGLILKYRREVCVAVNKTHQYGLLAAPAQRL